MKRHACRSRRAFTLVEAVVSLGITACAGSALLLGISNSLKSTNDMLDQTMALGMAQQLMDEISGKRYCGKLSGEGPYQVTLGPAASEVVGSQRWRFDDIDDYNGYSARPPKDIYGINLGTDNGVGGTRNPSFYATAGYYDRWQQYIEVYYVNATNLSQRLSAGQTSDFRAVEVTIYYDDPTLGARKVASLRRVIAYVPTI